MNQLLAKFKNSIWVVACLLIPFVVTTFVSQRHGMDLATYNQWVDQFLAKPQDSFIQFYQNVTSNYPVIGNIFSVGTITLIRTLNPTIEFWQMTDWFRYSLAVFDVINALLIFWFLRRSQFAFAGLFAALFALSPSTWAPASAWGQLEGVDQVILFMTLFANLLWHEGLNRTDTPAPLRYGYLSIFGFIACLFSKQILIFSLPFLFIFTAYNFYNQWKKYSLEETGRLVRLGCFALAAFTALDFTMDLPNGFKSQMLYIWLGGGSQHADEMALNGFNIWIAAGLPMKASSLDTLFAHLTYKEVGISLFVFMTIYLSFQFIKTLRRLHEVSIVPNQTKAGHFLLIFSMSQLAFNLILTGTHERYLYHFYPTFLLSLALLYNSRYLPLKHLLIAGAGAAAYGLFNWSILFDTSLMETTWKHYAMFALHAYYFAFAIYHDRKLAQYENELKSSSSFSNALQSAYDKLAS